MHDCSTTITNSQSLVKLMSLESVMPSNHFILCHPLVVEQNAVRDLKSELCECRQDNERLLKSLNDVQKEVLQLRCGPPARLPLLAVLSLGFWAKVSARCMVPTTFFPALK